MTTPPPTPTPEASRHHSYHVGPMFITLFCGILLAGGSCVGFVSTITSNSSGASSLFVIGFSVGVLAIIAFHIWALAAIITFFVRAARGEQRASR